MLSDKISSERLRTTGESLLVAAYDGDEVKLLELLRQGVNVNELVDEFRMNSLHLAIRNGHFKLISHLIKAGIDTEQGDYFNYKPLHYVENSREKEKCLKELIKCNVSLDSVEYYNNNLLHIFLHNFHHDSKYPGLVKTLVKHGADLNGLNSYGFNPLHMLAKIEFGGQSAGELADLLIRNGANMNVQCKDKSQTPLHLAIIHKNFSVVNSLMRNGAVLNLRDFKSKTALDHHIFEISGMPIQMTVTIIKYVVLRKEKGEHIDDTIMKIIDSSKMLKDMKAHCEQYLGYLKHIEVSPSHRVTYFNILSDSKHRVAKYLRNPEILAACSVKNLKRGSYWNEVSKKLEDAEHLFKLQNYAFTLTFELLKEKQLPDICIENISRFLNPGDLKYFTRLNM